MMGICDDEGLFAILLFPLKLQGLIEFTVIPSYLNLRPDDLHAKAHTASRHFNDTVDGWVLRRLGDLEAQVPED